MVMQHHVGVAHGELHQSSLRGLAPCPQESVTSAEPAWLVPCDGESQARLQRCVVGADVVAPVAVALLDPAGGEGVEAARPRAVSARHLGDGVPHVGGELRRDVELPAQLADVGDPQRAYERGAELDLLGRAEGERVVAEVRRGELGEEVAAARSHDGDRGETRRDVGGPGAGVADRGAKPSEVAPAGGGPGDDEVLVLSGSGHREIGLDAAVVVAPLRVDDPADLDVDVVGRDVVQHGGRIRPADDVLRVAAEVEEPDRVAHRPVLGGVGVEPVGTAVAVPVGRGGSGLTEPVGAFPAAQLPEAGPRRGESVVQR